MKKRILIPFIAILIVISLLGISTPCLADDISLGKQTEHQAIPENYYRHMARGEAFVETAKDKDEYKRAAREFQKAADAAPWLADPYYNLGVVQDKAGLYDDAIRNLKLYLLTAPDAEDARTVRSLIYKIEVRKEEARRTAIEKKKAEEKQGNPFNGKWRSYLGHANHDWEILGSGFHFTVSCIRYTHKTDSSLNSCAWFGKPYKFSVTARGRELSGTYSTHPPVPYGTKVFNSYYLDQFPPLDLSITLRLSADGNELEVRYVIYGSTCDATSCWRTNRINKNETWVRIK